MCAAAAPSGQEILISLHCLADKLSHQHGLTAAGFTNDKNHPSLAVQRGSQMVV